MDTQVAAPIRKSLLRKISWFGGDRRLVGGCGLIFGALGWTMFYAYGFFWGIPFAVPSVMFAGCVWVAREAYAADPYMVDVVLRQFKYKRYYAPKPDLGVPHPEVKDYI